MRRFLLLAAVLLSALSLSAQTYTVTPSATTYSSLGGQISFTVTLNYPAGASTAGFNATPPSLKPLWQHESTGGPDLPPIAPAPGADADPSTAPLGWTYINAPVNTATFTFVLSYSAGLAGPQTFTFTGNYQFSGKQTVTIAPITLTQATTPGSPVVTSHPLNTTATVGQPAIISVGVTGSPAPTIQWARSTDGGATFFDLANDSTFSGVTTSALSLNVPALSMTGHRFRARAANASGNATSNAATLTVVQAPAITLQPLSQVAQAGGNVSLTVAATGSGTLTYQWYFTPLGSSTPQSLAGATAATLNLTNVQAANAGDYVCVVSNGITPPATSSAAQLSVFPRVVRILSQTAAPGATVVVPVQLVAHGEEHALGFSINFTAAQLTFVSAVLGAQASDATLIVNDGQAASGRVGIIMEKPPGAVWSAGAQEVVKFTFTIGASVPSATVVSLTFGDVPVTREVVSSTAQVLTAGYGDGNVTVAAGFEADMNASNSVTISDWVKIGRIVAGLDPRPAGADFLKADCAPRLNTDGTPRLGSGTLTIADWVQAGRYAAGLDPLTNVGGPADTTPLR